MSEQIEPFWKLLETNFPLGGVRKRLFDLLPKEIVSELEKASLLTYQRMSDTYPCPHPGGNDCPRVAVEMSDGSYRAVCGNHPPECDDIVLHPEDIEFLSVTPKTLCEKIAKALKIKPQFEPIMGLRGVYRLGVFIPEAGVRQSVFFIIRCSKTEYAEVLDALRSRQERGGYAVLVPTDRFIADDTARQMALLGIPLLPIDDVFELENGKLKSLVDPLSYFGGIGQRGPGKAISAPTVVAQALVCNGKSRSIWRNLDEQGYQQLVAESDDYLVFADELTKTVTKGNGNNRKTKTKIKVAHFRMIRAAVSKTAGYFDPAIDNPDEDQISGKQVFQRARSLFDIGRGSIWMLFKSIKMEKTARYHFSPDAGATFAFIFVPS